MANMTYLTDEGYSRALSFEKDYPVQTAEWFKSMLDQMRKDPYVINGNHRLESEKGWMLIMRALDFIHRMVDRFPQDMEVVKNQIIGIPLRENALKGPWFRCTNRKSDLNILKNVVETVNLILQQKFPVNPIPARIFGGVLHNRKGTQYHHPANVLRQHPGLVHNIQNFYMNRPLKYGAKANEYLV